MLLQLENTQKANIQKLFVFAKENSLKLSFVDADKTKTYLPGKALSSKETKQLIEHSRKSGIVTMEKVHKQIRKKLNAH